jgi:hypothetical protein
MTGMHDVVVIASRVVAGVVALIAFYFALFLYEDEEGVWQNRIENLWVAVYDRAKVTDSTSTALFNRIGQTLNRVFSRSFGERLLSFRAFVTSLNVSLVGSYLAMACVVYAYKGPWLLNIRLECIGGVLVCSCLVYLQVKFVNRLMIFISSLPFIFLVTEMLLAIFIADQRLMTSVVLVLPAVMLSSFLTDYFAIIIMRRLFASMSVGVSAIRLVSTMVALISLTVSISVVPVVVAAWLSTQVLPTSPEISFLAQLFTFNVATACLCLVPVVMLGVVLIHKLLWPFLSRLLYPVASRRVMTNRKVLIAIGMSGLAIALNFEDFGWKFLIDHTK